MRMVLWIIAVLVGLLWMTMVVLFVSTDIELLDPEEQRQLKRGKHFWEWRSPHGPLAMHYVEKGTGSNHILLIHAFRSHSYTWKALMDPLASAGYHVWSIDLIGFGLSDKPDNILYNVDFFIQQIQAFMEAKGITEAHFVGNSMGGGLALSLALAQPQRVHSLTLLSALGYPLDLPLYLSLAKHIHQLWVPFLVPTMVRQTLKHIVYDVGKITDEQVEAYSLPYRFPGGVSASLLTLQKFDNQLLAEMGKRYASLTHPMLVIWGDHDRLIPPSHYEKFLKDFPHADRLLITGCGHIPQEENPQQVLSKMLEFLQKIESH